MVCVGDYYYLFCIDAVAGYRNYSQTFTYPFTFPGCTIPGKVHVGQQNDPFRSVVKRLNPLFVVLLTQPNLQASTSARCLI